MGRHFGQRTGGVNPVTGKMSVLHRNHMIADVATFGGANLAFRDSLERTALETGYFDNFLDSL